MQVTPGCPETDASYTWLSWDRCKLHLAVLRQMQVTFGCPRTDASYTWLSWDRRMLHPTLLQSRAESVLHFPARPLFSVSRGDRWGIWSNEETKFLLHQFKSGPSHRAQSAQLELSQLWGPAKPGSNNRQADKCACVCARVTVCACVCVCAF